VLYIGSRKFAQVAANDMPAGCLELLALLHVLETWREGNEYGAVFPTTDVVPVTRPLLQHRRKKIASCASGSEVPLEDRLWDLQVDLKSIRDSVTYFGSLTDGSRNGGW